MRTFLVAIALIALTAGSAAAQDPTPELTSQLAFRGDSTSLTRPSRHILAQIVEQLHAQPDLHVHVTAYGVESKDPLVSATARADAIAGYLQRRGVDPRRIHAFGVRDTAAHATVRWSRALTRTTPPKHLGGPALASVTARR